MLPGAGPTSGPPGTIIFMPPAESPRALIIRAPGTNCDAELCRAFALAGAAPELVHLDHLCRQPADLDRFDLVGFPGGFSYGDDIASGRLFAMKVRERLYPALREAVFRGVPIIGVCNGFQVLVQVGLLPGPEAGYAWPEGAPPRPSLALADNQTARFIARWVGVAYEPASVCVWTKGLAGPPADPAAAAPANMLPIAHGEGRLVASGDLVLDALERAGQVALRYTDNANGSARAIAGVCDTSGRVLGLMPHPERFLDWNRHPFATRLDTTLRATPTPGLRLFQNAVAAVAGARAF
jgi:phosphoribosylformylglycinamidine synthase